MASSVIAAQMYTLRDFTKTPDDIARSLSRVREIGYEAVQLSALGPIDANELGGILKREGLTACATHNSFDRLRNETQAVIEELNLWGCKYTAIAAMPGEYRGRDGVKRFVGEAEEIGGRLQEGGITLGYHNHAFELERINGKTALEYIYDETDPARLTAEIDTYWIQYGGGDPAQWIRDLKGRIPLVHLKDMTVRDNKPIMAEVGEGNLNWRAMLSACKEARVEWYIVEQDQCERDPFESLGISLRNLLTMGVL